MTQRFLSPFALFLGLAFLMLGLLGYFYYMEHGNRLGLPAYSTTEIRRYHAMMDHLQNIEYQNANLASRLVELQYQIAQRYEVVNQRAIQSLSQFIGNQEQAGPGVEVVLRDNNNPVLLGDNPNIGIVHNTDLLQVVNQLRAAGAKGISINGQPITQSSAIICSGPIVMVNGVRLATPFRVQALGNPKKLLSTLQEKDGHIQSLKDYGIDVSLTETDVLIPATPIRNL